MQGLTLTITPDCAIIDGHSSMTRDDSSEFKCARTRLSTWLAHPLPHTWIARGGDDKRIQPHGDNVACEESEELSSSHSHWQYRFAQNKVHAGGFTMGLLHWPITWSWTPYISSGNAHQPDMFPSRSDKARNGRVKTRFILSWVYTNQRGQHLFDINCLQLKNQAL